MTQQSNDRVAVVTGGAMGIGEAISLRLANDGLTVVVADINMDAATGVADRIASCGGRATPMELNVARPDSVSAGFLLIEERYGRCDVLVNNAGIARPCSFLEFPLENWQQTMDVNVTGTLLCGQHAARMMIRHRWGRIVNIASVSGFRASSGRTAYGTSKAAVMGLTRQMAIELAPHGITANAVAPGPVDTPLTRQLHSEASRLLFAKTVPAGRYGQTDEIASAVSYLASVEASYVNGHVLPVDGGFVAAGVMDH